MFRLPLDFPGLVWRSLPCPGLTAEVAAGQRKQDANAVALHIHGKGPQGAKPKGEVVADILAAIRERRAKLPS